MNRRRDPLDILEDFGLAIQVDDSTGLGQPVASPDPLPSSRQGRYELAEKADPLDILASLGIRVDAPAAALPAATVAPPAPVRPANSVVLPQARREPVPYEAPIVSDSVAVGAPVPPPAPPVPAEEGFGDRAGARFSRGLESAQLDEDSFNAAIGLGDWQDVLARRKALQARSEAKPYVSTSKGIAGFVEDAVLSAAEMAGPMAKGLLQGGVMSGGAAALSGPAAPVTAPIAGAFGAAQYWFRQGVGSMTAAQIEQGVDPAVAASISMPLGYFYAIIEQLQVARIAPGVKTEAAKAFGQTVARVLGKNAKQYGKDVGVELGEEMVQDAVHIASEETGKAVNNAIKGTALEGTSAAEIWQRAQDVVTEGGPGLAVLLLPGRMANAGGDLVALRRQRKAVEGVRKALEGLPADQQDVLLSAFTPEAQQAIAGRVVAQEQAPAEAPAAAAQGGLPATPVPGQRVEVPPAAQPGPAVAIPGRDPLQVVADLGVDVKAPTAAPAQPASRPPATAAPDVDVSGVVDELLQGAPAKAVATARLERLKTLKAKANEKSAPTLGGLLRDLGGVRWSAQMAPEFKRLDAQRQNALQRHGIVKNQGGEPSGTMVEQLKREFPELGINSESDLMAAVADPERMKRPIDMAGLDRLIAAEEEAYRRQQGMGSDEALADELESVGLADEAVESAVRGSAAPPAFDVVDARQRIAAAKSDDELYAILAEADAAVLAGAKVEISGLVTSATERARELEAETPPVAQGAAESAAPAGSTRVSHLASARRELAEADTPGAVGEVLQNNAALVLGDDWKLLFNEARARSSELQGKKVDEPIPADADTDAEVVEEQVVEVAPKAEEAVEAPATTGTARRYRHFTTSAGAEAFQRGERFGPPEGKENSYSQWRIVGEGDPPTWYPKGTIFGSLDDGFWASRKVRTQEGTPKPLNALPEAEQGRLWERNEAGDAHVWFDYDNQAWMYEEGTTQQQRLVPVDVDVRPDARVLEVGDLAGYEALVRAAGNRVDYDSPAFWETVGKRYDVVEVKNARELGRRDGPQRDKVGGAWRFWDQMTRDQAIILNPDVVQRIGQAPPADAGAAAQVGTPAPALPAAGDPVPTAPEPRPVPSAAPVAGAAVTEAADRLSLTFSQKPTKEIRDQLKAAGFRWSGPNKAWQVRLGDGRIAEQRALARAMAGVAEESQEVGAAAEVAGTEAAPAVEADAPRPETYFKGFRAEYTGESGLPTGSMGSNTMYAVEMMEGPDKGKTRWVVDPPAVVEVGGAALKIDDEVRPKKGSGIPASHAGRVQHIKEADGRQHVKTENSGNQYWYADEMELVAPEAEGPIVIPGLKEVARSPELRQAKHVGRNSDGRLLTEDESGVRSYSYEDGGNKFTRTEPVIMVPTREGVRAEFDPRRRTDDFLTKEEQAAAAPVKELKALADEVRGLRDELRGVAPRAQEVDIQGEEATDADEAEQPRSEALVGEGAPEGRAPATGPQAGGRRRLRPGGEVREPDVSGADADAGAGSGSARVSAPAVGVAGSEAAQRSEGETAGGAGGDAVVGVAADGDGLSDQPHAAANLDLRDKAPIRLTLGQRRRINDDARSILAARHESLTDEQKDVLRQYTGEGGLSSGTREALNQHYTDYPTIRAIFDAIEASGLQVGSALEPSVGSGNFVGNRPGYAWTTVDLDPTNHEVVKALYPKGTHYQMSFEDFAKSGYDLVVSNVPFLEIRGSGRHRNRPDIKALHDFYFVHALDRVRPGGVVAFITSAGTMDKKDSAIRQEIVDKADVLGAWRLPGGHFEENAHTSVTTDVIFLQRRPDGVEARTPQANAAFVLSEVGSEDANLSVYYREHPDHILGDLALGKEKMYGGRPAWVVSGEADLSKIRLPPHREFEGDKKGALKPEPEPEGPSLPDWLAQVERDGLVGRYYTDVPQAEFHEDVYVDDGDVWVVKETGSFADVGGQWKTYEKVAGEIADKVRALDQIGQLAARFQETDDPATADSAIEAIQSYQQAYKVHPSKDRKLKSFFKERGATSFVAEFGALFDEDFNPADVFLTQTRYVGSGRAAATEESPVAQRALHHEDTRGVVRVGGQDGARLLSMADVPQLLHGGYGLLALDKDRAVLQNSILYYSGNVYSKIASAEKIVAALDGGLKVPDAPALRDALEKQIAELEAIKPPPMPLAEMDFKGNEPWLRDLLHAAKLMDVEVVSRGRDGDPDVLAYSLAYRVVREGPNYSEFAGSRSNHPYDNFLGNKPLVSRAKTDDVLEPMGQYMARYREAQDEVAFLRSRLLEEILADEELTARIEYAFNSKFRAYVKPDYDKARYLIDDVLAEVEANTAHVKTKDGKPFGLRRNQVEWVIQASYEGKGINAHDVGGGKTMAAIVLARVMKKRGMANKPIFVVPAKTIHKWVRETQLLFPDAKIVNLGKLAKEERQRQLFALANTNADYVFVSHEGFANIQLPLDADMAYLDEVLAENMVVAKGRSAGKKAVKADDFREALFSQPRDARLTFDGLGIDMILADEAHAYKNIGMPEALVRQYSVGVQFGFNKDSEGNITGLSSARSYDFRAKTNYIVDQNNGRNVFLLTATPATNKPMELYAMLRHLGRDVFQDYGIASATDFADQFFGFEVIEAQGGKPKGILSEIRNAPELRGILDRYVSKIPMSQMPWIAVPEEQSLEHYLEPSEHYQEIADDLEDRRSKLKKPQDVREGDDTLVGLYTGGRSASVDPRLYGGEHAGVQVAERTYDSANDKVQWTIERAAEVVMAGKNSGVLIFVNDAGHTQTERGLMERNLHREMKAELVKRGLTEKQVAIISGKEVTNPETGRDTASGDKDQKKQDIADAYNAGKIKVLIGTTQSMGEGMDLQVKTTDIIHLDIPYVPGEIRQRNGRGVRYGNEHGKVRVHYLFMKGSFDQMSFQIVANKKGWNEAIWERDLQPTISVREEMQDGAMPPRQQILLNLARDPEERRLLELSFERDRLQQERQDAFAFQGSAKSKVLGKEKQIANLDRVVRERRARLDEIEPNPKIEDLAERREKFLATKERVRKTVQTAEENLARVRAELPPVVAKAAAAQEVYSRAAMALVKWEADHVDENGNVTSGPRNLGEALVSAMADAHPFKYLGDNWMEVLSKQPESNLNPAQARALRHARKHGWRPPWPENAELRYPPPGLPLEHETDDEDGIQLGMGFDPQQAARAVVALTRAGAEALTRRPGRAFRYRVGSLETQERMAAARGLQRPSALSKLGEWAERFKNQLLREWEFLPKTAEYAELRFALTELGKQRGVASYKAIEALDNITDALDAGQYELFTLKVILDDLVNEADQGRDLAFDFNVIPGDASNVYDAAAQIDAEVVGDPRVQEAVAHRARIWADLKADYIQAMRAAGSNVEGKFQNDAYYRHQVLKYAQLKSSRLAGTKGLHAPTGRGFLRKRGGSDMDINADYLEAEYEVMAQMIYDVKRAEVIKTVDRQHNVRRRLKEQARQHNDTQIMRVFQAMAQRMNAQQGSQSLGANLGMAPLTADSLYRQMLNKTQAMGFSKLNALAKAGELPDNGQWDDLIDALATGNRADTGQILAYASWVLNQHDGTPAAMAARMIFKGIREKSEFIETTLRKLGTFKTWEDFIPEGYSTWQPQEGNVFFLADTIPARAAQAILDGTLAQIGLTQEDIRKAFVVGGRRREFVLPDEVIAQMDDMVAQKPGFLNKIIATPQRAWKVNILLNPRRLVKYNIRNMTGDADAVFVGNPGAFKKMPQAAKDLYLSMVGVKRDGLRPVIRPEHLTGELREWFVRGGAGSTLSVQEMEEIGELRIFRHRFHPDDLNALEKLARLPARAWKAYWTAARVSTDFRESLLRYAAYLDYLGQAQRNPGGRPDNFGASRREEVMALKDVRDRAFKLSNDLLGAYDEVGVVGQALRRYLMPFWSWNEVNARRYKRLAANAWEDGKTAQMVGRKLLGTTVKSPLLLARVGKFALKAAALAALFQTWNRLFFDDEEEDLPADVRERPHVIFGRDDEGKVIYFSRIGALGDFLEWFGLDAAPSLVDDLFAGKISLQEAAKEMALAPVEKVVQGISPIYKVPFELLMRRQLFPDMWRPRTIRDRGLYIASTLGLQEEYRAVADLPWKDYQDTVGDVFVYRADPLQSAYSATFEERQAWLKDQGKEREGFMLTPAGQALYNLRLAVRYEDDEAQKVYLRKYLEGGGDMQGLKQSFRMMHPLGTLSQENQQAFVAQLDGRARVDLAKAIQFYDQVLLGPGPEGVVFRHLEDIRPMLSRDDLRVMVARQDALARIGGPESRREAQRRRDKLVAPYGGLQGYVRSLSRKRPPAGSDAKTSELSRFFDYRDNLMGRIRKGEVP